MVASREEAARRAEASRTNSPGTCQLWTRTQYDAPSAGDFDHDGDADAVDGWKSEPVSARHTDRKPPRGTPVAWSGGSHGNGHRAVSLGPIGGVYKIRSTDAGGSGHVATVDLDWPERTWGLHYLGWSETIDGLKIPGGDPTPAPTPKPPRKPRQYVVDVSPRYQPGFNFQRAADEGIDAFIIKCTEGHTINYGPMFTTMVRRAQATGKSVAVYHFLHDTVPGVQAAYLAQHIGDKSLPVMLDVERRSMPNLATVLAFITEAKVRGLRVSSLYLPRWYWEEIGKPDLTDPALRGVALINSAYGRNFAATPRVAYRLNASFGRWSKMGGKGVNLVQFGSRVKIAGAEVDCSLHRGQATQVEHWFRAKTAPVPDPKPDPPPVDPPPPPKPTHARISAISWNVGNGHDSAKVTDLTELSTHAHLIGLQEASDRQDAVATFVKANPQWDAFSGTSTGAPAVPSLFRTDLFKLVEAKAHLCVPARNVGSKGAGPTVSKPKYATELHVVHRETGLHVHHINTHFLPSATRANLPAAERKKRRQHYRDHVAALVKIVESIPKGRLVILTMDANAPQSFSLLKPLHDVGLVGWQTQATHGRARIDNVLALGHVIKRTDATYQTSSDHLAAGAALRVRAS